MKNTFGRFMVCSIAVALIATVADARPKHTALSKDAEEATRAVAGPGGPLDTDFEAPLWCPGFFCGPEYICSTDYINPATGDCDFNTAGNRHGWITSNSNRHCAEPHVDTVHPASGTQHLRFAQDPNLPGGAACGNFPSFGTACRAYMLSDIDDQPLGPATIAFEMAVNSLGGVQSQWLIFDSNEGSTYWYYGHNGQFLFLNQNNSNFPLIVDGQYYTVEIGLNACDCTTFMTYNGQPVGGFGGNYCDGYTENLEQILLRTNNGPGWMDIDNLRVIRGGGCTPPVCGNGEVEAGEECDGAGPGSADCDGRECYADCTCECAPGDVGCSGDIADAVPVENGTTLIEGPSGGWFIYDVDSPAVAINTCGPDVNNIDTFLMLLGVVDGGVYPFWGYNDDCDESRFGYGQSDIYASCYGRAGKECSNQALACNTDADCITGYFCSGGGNNGALCPPGNDAACQGFCAGNPDIPTGTACAADGECQSTICTSGPGFLLGNACSAPGADNECTAFACGFPACSGVGDPCVDDADCGGTGGEFNFCQEVPGTCETVGECSQEGVCIGDGTCDGPYMDAPYESCLCDDYLFGYAGDALIQMNYFSEIEEGDQFNLNIEKRRSCAEPITTGMCCDVVAGSCTDGHESDVCTGGAVWVETKDCNPLSCPLRLGACCDGLAGTCVDSYPGLPDTHAGEVGVPIGMCQIGGGACTKGQCNWYEGQGCDEVTCVAATGACCDHAAGPLAEEGICELTTFNGCQGETKDWFKGENCSTIECTADFVAIPTVSEWGLVVLTLLLLIGAKVYFGRRSVATA